MMKKRNLGLFAIGTLAGGLAVPGAYALWTDADSADPGELSFGYDYMAAGTPGNLTSATWDGQTGTVEVPFWGPEQAQQLLDDGEIALVYQVEAISQGNGALTVTNDAAYLAYMEHEAGDSILGNADMFYSFPVSDPSECVVDPDISYWRDTAVNITLPTDDVAGSYTLMDDPYRIDTELIGQGDEPMVKYLCITAKVDGGDGVHENTATVQGQGPGGAPVTATDTLTVEGLSLLDPADEPVLTATFTAEFEQCHWTG